MEVLDFITRLILIPGVLLFIFTFIPEAIKDIKQWKRLFARADSKAANRKKKTVSVHTAAPVYPNSFNY